jgi:TPR repeat protein
MAMNIISAGLALLLIAAPLSTRAQGVKAAAPTAAALQQGCDAGDAKACEGLAEKLPANDPQAPPLFRKACDGGVPIACTVLGMMYYVGRGVPEDKDQATVLLRKACAGGDRTGCAMVPKN